MACLGLCVFSSALRGKLVRGFKTTTLRRIFLTHMLSENIFSFWAEKLGVLAKKYRHGCQNCNLRTSKNFWGKTVFFLKLNLIANFFGLRDEKIGLLVKNFPSGFLQQEFALPEKCLEEKWNLFRQSFIFLLSFLEFEWFLCLFCKVLLSGVSNNRSTCGGK